MAVRLFFAVLFFLATFPGALCASEIQPFVYVPTGTDVSGTQTISFQPYAKFTDDFNLWGANLVFSQTGSGLYFPVAVVDFDHGNSGVLFGVGYNKFFQSGAKNGRWLGDVRYTHTTEMNTNSITGAATHVWYTGSAIPYFGGHLSGVFGDTDGLGWGVHGGVKFDLGNRFVLEVQTDYNELDSDGLWGAGVTVGISL